METVITTVCAEVADKISLWKFAKEMQMLNLL